MHVISSCSGLWALHCATSAYPTEKGVKINVIKYILPWIFIFGIHVHWCVYTKYSGGIRTHVLCNSRAVSRPVCFVFERARYQGIFSSEKGTLWRKCEFLLEHFKGTKATTKGMEAIAFIASVKYQAWVSYRCTFSMVILTRPPRLPCS